MLSVLGQAEAAAIAYFKQAVADLFPTAAVTILNGSKARAYGEGPAPSAADCGVSVSVLESMTLEETRPPMQPTVKATGLYKLCAVCQSHSQRQQQQARPSAEVGAQVTKISVLSKHARSKSNCFGVCCTASITTPS